uniref:Synapse differentiation inducing 1 n=1 Tax=Cyanoderma ruficeps TaxID=181631 RepID=A0A8C3RJ25_9PASS
MDGLVEQNSVLMHSKITEAGKRNGLINTRNLVTERRDGLVTVYPTPQYQSHRVGNLSSPRCPENGRSDPVQQLLDPSMLQQTVESHYRPNIILYSENVLRSWGESLGSECCETTFIEERSPTKDSLEYPDSKFIDLSTDDIKIHTLSYEVEEEEDFQELEFEELTKPNCRICYSASCHLPQDGFIQLNTSRTICWQGDTFFPSQAWGLQRAWEMQQRSRRHPNHGLYPAATFNQLICWDFFTSRASQVLVECCSVCLKKS